MSIKSDNNNLPYAIKSKSYSELSKSPNINPINKQHNEALYLNESLKKNSKTEFIKNIPLVSQVDNAKIRILQENLEKKIDLRPSLNLSIKKVQTGANTALPTPKHIKIINKILDSYYFIGIMMLITIYVLFISDIQAACISKDSDSIVDITQTTCFILFTVEIVLSSIALDNYFLSFFFTLDIISTLSLLQDIGFIFNPIIGLLANSGSFTATKSVFKASSTGRITRVLRIVRIIRLIRIVKLYKSALNTRKMIAKKRKEILKSKLKLSEKSNRSSYKQSPAVDPLPVDSNANIDQEEEDHKLSFNNRSNARSNASQNLKNFMLKFNDKPMIMEDSPPKVHRGSVMSKVDCANDKVIKSDISNNLGNDEKIESLIKESQISKVLTESITKKTIILILTLLLCLQLLSDDQYTSNLNTYDQYIVDFLEATYQTPDNNFYLIEDNNNLIIFRDGYHYINPNNQYITNEITLFNQTVFTHLFYNSSFTNTVDDLSLICFEVASINLGFVFPLINITYNNSLIYYNESTQFYNFRDIEIGGSISENKTVIALVSQLYDTQLTGILNIVKTIFIMLILIVFAVVFENDIKKIILDPLDIMIEIVEMVESDPTVATNNQNLKNGIKQQVINIENNSPIVKKKKKLKEDYSDKYEVMKIENAIVKISGLLAICFGEAGGEIIKKNLEKGKEFNPMIEGKKKFAIFGFCDIRQFQAINDALQENTMIFVNQISEIVHSSANLFSGATNKNIGDA